MFKKGEKMVLSDKELTDTIGGSVKYGWFVALGGLVTILVGMIDGYIRPLSCNQWL